ncbi:MAG: hypothetical protein HW398_666, partial [Acidobacteria bacterium]|nr:hypothetical protein [Acidobacteriota bacterium]
MGRHRTKLLVILFLLIAGAWVSTWPNVQWRTRLISLKSRGLLPRANWSDLLFRLNPQERLPRDWAVPSILVKVKQRGEE